MEDPFQALVFHGDGSALTCEALFRPEWTMKLYVTWYAISNLFVPLAVLMFCYGRIWEEEEELVAKLDQMHWKFAKVLPVTLTLGERELHSVEFEVKGRKVLIAW